MDKRRLIAALLWVSATYPAAAQAPAPPAKTPVRGFVAASVATAWADMTVRVMTKAPRHTPTYGSRALGYLGLTMYETVVYASAQHQSVAAQLCDTPALPKPDLRKAYCWELALNAGQAYMLKALYAYTERTGPIDSLAGVIYRQQAARVTPAVARRSEAFGRAVAARLFGWSQADGGHEGYTRNFPADHVRAEGPGLWAPPYIGQANSRFPMHPTWGQNRLFAPRNARLPLPAPLPFATDTTGAFYRQCREVYTRAKTLTPSDLATVMWWGDDPGETCSPPGHSYNLATIAVRQSGADGVKAAETYARVGMAVADAFVCCWKAKYAYSVERPAAYINRYIHPIAHLKPWLPFFPEPPFPSFYSGHAVQSAAMATVLTQLYGEAFAFTDDTHVSRRAFEYTTLRPQTGVVDEATGQFRYPELDWHSLPYTARRYASFWDAARDCAESRLMGGIHTRHDNDVGLAEGTKIAQNVNALPWKR